MQTNGNVSQSSLSQSEQSGEIILDLDQSTDSEQGTEDPGDTDSAQCRVSRDKKRELMRTTLRHPSELTIAQDGSFADDGRAKLPVSESLIRGMLYFSDRDGRAEERRAFQELQPGIVSIQGTDENPVFTLTDGRQRCKAASAINERVASIVPLWDACKHDKVKTRNVLVALAGYYDSVATHGASSPNCADVPKVLNDLSDDAREALSWVNGVTMTEELAALYVGGEVDNEKHHGLLRVTAEKTGAAIPYFLKVKYGDADSTNARTLAISATLKNVQIPNLPSMEAEQIQRLMDVMVTGKDGKPARKYSDESIAGFLNVSIPTLHNRLLILKVEPAVRDAVDNGDISWTTLKTAFFHSVKRGNIQPLSPPEQLDLLSEMLNRGISKSTQAAAAGLVPAPSSSAQSDAPSDSQSTDSDSSDVSSASAVGRPKKANVRLIGDEGYFSRAAARLEEAVNTAPDPDADDIFGDEIINRRTNRSLIEAAQCIILFLKNNDPAALDEYPTLKTALTAALEVPNPILPKRKITPTQFVVNAIRSSFEAWEGIRADERPEWPSDENPAVQEAINKIAVDFDLQDEGDPSYVTDKVEFAMQYGLRMLDASQAA